MMAGGKKDLSRISKPMGIELKTKEREIWRPFKFEAHPTKKKTLFERYNHSRISKIVS